MFNGILCNPTASNTENDIKIILYNPEVYEVYDPSYQLDIEKIFVWCLGMVSSETIPWKDTMNPSLIPNTVREMIT